MLVATEESGSSEGLKAGGQEVESELFGDEFSRESCALLQFYCKVSLR